MTKTRVLKATAHALFGQHKRALALFAAVALVIVYSAPVATALTHTGASLSLSDSRPGNAGGTGVKYTYNVTGGIQNQPVRCVKMVFATTVAGSTMPTGMVTSGVTLDTAATNYLTAPASYTTTSVTPGTVNIVFATGAAPPATSNRTIAINNITNSTVADTTYYLKVNTYGNQDCTATPLDNSVVAYIVTNGTAVTMNVDPSLTFTVAGTTSGTACNSSANSTVTTTGTTVPFGTVTSGANGLGVQNLTTTTNAGTGYTVMARYTAAPTSGANTIADHGGGVPVPNSAPTAFSAAGTEAYGYTTNDGTLGTGTVGRFTATGGNKWAAFSTTNAEVAYSASGVTAEAVCVGHQVGIAGTTPAGSYATSVIYTATPIY
jgi:hypothetical protein